MASEGTLAVVTGDGLGREHLMTELLISLGDATESVDLDHVTDAIRAALATLRLTVHEVRFADDDEDLTEPPPRRSMRQVARRPLVGPDAVVLVTEVIEPLHDAGGQLWIVYPEPFADLGTMEDRLRSAWGWGPTEDEALERARGTHKKWT